MTFHSALSRTLQVSLFTNTRDTDPKSKKLAWPDDFLEDRVHDGAAKSEHYVDGDWVPLFSPASFSGPRKESNVVDVCALVLDIDHTTKTIADALSAFADHELVYYTTRSHTADAPSFRIVLPYTRPATPAEQRATWIAAQSRISTDTKCKDIGRMYFMPSHAPQVVPLSGHQSGRLLDPSMAIVDRWPVEEQQELFAAALPVAAPVTAPSGGKRKAPEHAQSRGEEGAAQGAAVTSPHGFKVLQGFVAKLVQAQEGERHNAIIKACFTLGGLSATGHVARKDFVDAVCPIVCSWPNSEKRWDKAMEAFDRGFLNPLLGTPTKEAAIAPAVPPAPVVLHDTAVNVDAQQMTVDALMKHLEEDAPVERFIMGKSGPRPILENVRRAVAKDGYWWNELKECAMLHDKSVDEHHVREVTGRISAAHGIHTTPAVVRDGILLAARVDRRDPILQYLDGLTWDGVSRLDDLALCGFCGASGDEKEDRYNAVRVRLHVISMIARARKPGCKADSMLVLTAPDGGEGKTSCMLALVGEDTSRMNSTLIDPDDGKRAMMILNRYWVHEMAEMPSVRDIEVYKAFLSDTRVSGVRLFGHDAEDNPRRCVFFGTSQRDFCLSDENGDNRRFWVCRVKSVDLAWIRAHRDQLLAEADARYKAGERWWTSKEEQAETGKRNEFVVLKSTAVEDALRDHISTCSRDSWRVLDLLVPIGERFGKKLPSEKSIGLALRSCGWSRHRNEKGITWRWTGAPKDCKNPCPPRKIGALEQKALDAAIANGTLGEGVFLPADASGESGEFVPPGGFSH